MMFTLETYNGCSELRREDELGDGASIAPLIDDFLLYDDPPLPTTLFIDVCEGCGSTFSG